MNENNKQVKPSKVVSLLVNTCRRLHAQGIDVNGSLLKIHKPNHSNRDYTAALDLFNDELRMLTECSVPLPEDSREYFDMTIKSMWTNLVNTYEARIKKLKDEHESALFDARKARDSVVDENEELKATLEKRDEIISVMRKNEEEGKRKELQNQSKIRNLETEVTSLKAKLETVQQNYDKLTGWKVCSEQQEQKV